MRRKEPRLLTRSAIREAINRDPEIARRVASHQALRDSLRSSFEPVLAEAVPRPAARRRTLQARESSDSNVVPLRSRTKAPAPVRPCRNGRPSRQASFSARSHCNSRRACAFAINHGAQRTTAGRRSITTGVVEPTVRVASDSPIRTHRHQLSFKKGQYCRTFQLPQSTSLSGLACNEAGNWKVEILLVRTARPPPTRNIAQRVLTCRRPSFRPSTTTLPVTHGWQSRKRAHGAGSATYSVR